jgi:isoquinoline 1-oxidoreductase
MRGAAMPEQIDAWLHIDVHGGVTVYTGKVEVGQNARTSLTQSVAEELHVPVGSIQVVMGDTELTPFDMGTFGSRTTPTMVPQLRRAAAAARGVIQDLAAAQWQVDRSMVAMEAGKATHATTHRSLTYAELLKGQKLLQAIPAEIPLTPTQDWKVMGTAVHKVDGRAFVTGRHRYTTDVKRDGMLYGKVLRPAGFHATLKSVDTAAAEAMSGVKVVHDGDFVGVVAPSAQAAERALATIQAEWEVPAQPSNEALFDLLRPKPAGEASATIGVEAAEPVPGTETGNVRLKTTYTVAYIAHTPLEPRAAVAEWQGDQLTVWTGTQRPFGVRGDLASALKVPQDRVRVIVPDTGSGYGGKHTGEVAIEAARLARGAGRPVKLVWTRVEEFTWAYFRPAGVIDVSASVAVDGTLKSWEFDNYNSGPSGIGTPYVVPDPRTDFHPAKAPLREGSYRGLAATANHFARECHMDALAHAVRLDPLAFRLKNLMDTRLRTVLEAAASRFGWDHRRATPGRGYGIAGGTEKGSYVATCAEIEVDPGSGDVRVTRIVTAFECGAIVNPTHLQNQVEGATVMGLGGALFEAIRFADGRILNPHFATYRVPRFGDVPPIEIVLLDRKDLPSAGAGETPIVGIAPAIGNAIFDATGRRITSMPLAPEGLKSPGAAA